MKILNIQNTRKILLTLVFLFLFSFFPFSFVFGWGTTCVRTQPIIEWNAVYNPSTQKFTVNYRAIYCIQKDLIYNCGEDIDYAMHNIDANFCGTLSNGAGGTGNHIWLFDCVGSPYACCGQPTYEECKNAIDNNWYGHWQYKCYSHAVGINRCTGNILPSSNYIKRVFYPFSSPQYLSECPSTFPYDGRGYKTPWREVVVDRDSLGNTIIAQYSFYHGDDTHCDRTRVTKVGIAKLPDCEYHPETNSFSGSCCNDSRISGINCTPSPSLSVSCSASPNPASVGETVTFTSSVSGGTGSFSYSWSGACTGNSSTCERSFSSPGTYSATITVTSGSETRSATCSVSVEANTQCQPHTYKACYDNDVYWFDSCWRREEKYEECGEDYWTGNYRCSGNVVQREKAERSCQNGACVTHYVWYDYENCGSNRVCQNGVCVPSYSSLNVSCSASPNPASVGETVTFTSSVSGGTGSFSYSWSGACTGNSSTCERSFSSPGTYSATITVTSGSETRSATCWVEVEEDYSRHHLGCYNDDVYWFNRYGERLSKYQECGSDYCTDWEKYCFNGKVYKKRTCYTKGCADGACYSHSFVERRFVKSCGENQTCKDGKCVSECECSEGPCCDGCHYKPSTVICDSKIETQYGCPWGRECGADVGKRFKSKFRYCSGNSAQCDGKWTDWTFGNWLVADYCTFSEVCVPGLSKCQYSSSCAVPSGPTYIKHYTKGCFNNDLYWFDSNGIRQEKYRECSDNNSCTIDTCRGNDCVFDLKCDGSTCPVGSEDYCKNCSHCGDKVCNCDETICTCPEDCGALSMSILAKSTEGGRGLWEEEIEVSPGEEIDIIAIITNAGPESLQNLRVKFTLPEGIDYLGNLLVDGKPLSGDIETGISLDELQPSETKTITFQAKVQRITGKDISLSGEVLSDRGSAMDSLLIHLSEKGLGRAGLIFSASIFKKWYFWFLILPLALIFLYYLFKRIISLKQGFTQTP